MLPDRLFLIVVGGLAVLVVSALPFQGWRGWLKNVVIGLVVAAVAVAGALLLGAMMHVAIFGEPVMLD